MTSARFAVSAFCLAVKVSISAAVMSLKHEKDWHPMVVSLAGWSLSLTFITFRVEVAFFVNASWDPLWNGSAAVPLALCVSA